jgi:hypothetical protein
VSAVATYAENGKDCVFRRKAAHDSMKAATAEGAGQIKEIAN